MDDFLQFVLKHAGVFQACWFFFLTLLGAVVTQVLSFNLGNVGTVSFLKIWKPEKSEAWYARCNCVLLVLVGTLLSYIILDPNSAKSSFFAGLTWCGTLQSLGQTIKHDPNG